MSALRRYSLVATLVLLITFYVTSVLFAYRSAFGGPLSSDQAIWGQFGDYIGGLVNPILAFLSFVGVLATLHLQIRQLDLAAGSLAAARQESERALSTALAAERSLSEMAEQMMRHSRAAHRSVELLSLTAAISALAEVEESKNAQGALGASLAGAAKEERMQLAARLLAMAREVASPTAYESDA